MFCIKCGATIADGSRLCPNCGSPIMASESANQNPDAANQNPDTDNQNQSAANQQYQQGNFQQGDYQQDGFQQGGYGQGGYQQGGYQEGGYGQGGYQQGGYQQGGYGQGGYQQGGYQQGGYGQGGYQQGGYGQNPYGYGGMPGPSSTNSIQARIAAAKQGVAPCISIPGLGPLYLSNLIGIGSALLGLLSLFMQFVSAPSSHYYLYANYYLNYSLGLSAIQFMNGSGLLVMNIVVILCIISIVACHLIRYRIFSTIGSGGMVLYLILFFVIYSGSGMGYVNIGFFVYILSIVGCFFGALIKDQTP